MYKPYNNINSNFKPFKIILQQNLLSINHTPNLKNSSKQQLNKLTPKKPKPQPKPNNILYKHILPNFNKSTHPLLKTSFPLKKSHIYKQQIFSQLSHKHKKLPPNKFTNTILSFSQTFTQQNHKTPLQKLKKPFLHFYKQLYKLNHFSLSSLSSQNIKQTNKQIFKNPLQIIKK